MISSTEGVVLWKPRKTRVTISASYNRDSVLAKVSSFCKKTKPNTSMLRITILRDNSHVSKSKLILEYFPGKKS